MLESLKKWQWVDLFQEDGYQALIRALRVRADKITREFTGTEKQGINYISSKEQRN